MPLFMDFHKFDSVTVEAVKTAHMADIGVQDQYGVKYHQFWVNEEEGKVFCLVEGPDAATCEKVHMMAHGNIACALTEVDPGLYVKLMGHDHAIDHGHVKHKDGAVDLGYRSILVASVYSYATVNSSKETSQLLIPHWARKIINEQIVAHGGREVKWEIDDSLIGVFDDTSSSIECALQIQEALSENKMNEAPGIIFKMGISAAQPLTKEGDFFTSAMRLAHQLSIAAQDNQILISSLVRKLCKDEKLLMKKDIIMSLNDSEEEFVSKLLNISEANLSDLDFDITSLCSEICISRPQLYRKTKALTGRSPNDFMQDLRMNKALTLLKQKKANVTEIAFETGFNSPSYFTKCFIQKFGCKPSVFAKETRA
jgi:AraC-like DNA-binding protein